MLSPEARLRLLNARFGGQIVFDINIFAKKPPLKKEATERGESLDAFY